MRKSNVGTHSLRLISPVIRDHGVDYERNKFQGRLDDGTHTLERSEVLLFCASLLINHSTEKPSPQAWIKRTVAKEISDKAISPEDITSGKAATFAAVHTAAMFSLVVDPERIRLETCPETLLLDVGRLSSLQSEYNHIVDGATVLITATHAIIGSDPHPSQEKRQVLSRLTSFVIDNHFDSFTLKSDLCLELDAADVLMDTEARGKLLKALDSSITNKSDAVRQLM